MDKKKAKHKSKTWLKKVWHLIVSNWEWIVVTVLPVLVALFYVMSNQKRSLAATTEKLRDKYEKDKKNLQKKREEEIKNRVEVAKKYHKALEKIEKRYDSKLKKIKQNKKKQIQKTLSKYEDNPEKFVKELASQHGITYKKE